MRFLILIVIFSLLAIAILYGQASAILSAVYRPYWSVVVFDAALTAGAVFAYTKAHREDERRVLSLLALAFCAAFAFDFVIHISQNPARILTLCSFGSTDFAMVQLFRYGIVLFHRTGERDTAETAH